MTESQFLDRIREIKGANLAEEVKQFRFRLSEEVVVEALSLDDAIRDLRDVGHDVDDLTKVKWLD